MVVKRTCLNFKDGSNVSKERGEDDAEENETCLVGGHPGQTTRREDRADGFRDFPCFLQI